MRTAPQRDILCIGAADGCLFQLSRLISQLPADFPAAVFVGFRPHAVVRVADVLRRSAALHVADAMSDEPIVVGKIRVAPRDRQLRFTATRTKLDPVDLELVRRPTIDTLFGSAASRLGRRVVAVLLGGGEGDGSEGARAIHSCGGLVVVPVSAFASGTCAPAVPSVACRPDHVVPLMEMGSLLSRLAAAARPLLCAVPVVP